MANSREPISPQYKRAFLEAAEPLRFLEGQIICQEGDEDQTLYMLTEGSLNVSRETDGQTIIVATLKAGDLFGEVNFIFGTQRIATVTANEESQVFQIKRQQSSNVISKTPGLYNYLQNLAVSRWTATALLTHPIFQSLPLDVVHPLINEKSHQTLASGRSLFEQGDPIGRLWLHMSGTLEMFSSDDRNLEIFDAQNITPVEVLNNQPSTWRAVAVSECMIASLPLDQIQALAAEHAEFKKDLTQSLIQ